MIITMLKWELLDLVLSDQGVALCRPAGPTGSKARGPK